MADDTIKRINDPDPMLLRRSLRGQASEGKLQPTNGCPHPISALQQYVDETGYRHRDGRPTNLFACSICHMHGRIIMFDGIEARDG